MRCSGCLKPKHINIGDIHLFVKGLLYLERDDRVVETKLRFCLKVACVQNIQSLYNNIRPLASLTLKKDPSVGEFSQDELANIELEGFSIEGAMTVLPTL